MDVITFVRPLGRRVSDLDLSMFSMNKSSSCVTIAGGFTAFACGYTNCYGDIDIFCSKTAFQKLQEKVGDAHAGIRLLR